MTVITFTSQQFDQDPSGARKAAALGPVFIADQGAAAYVLLTMEHYMRLRGQSMSLAEALAQPAGDFEFDPPHVGIVIKPSHSG
jgi:hypothetical protein